jgi:mono/diheme cytochrome c family protein
MNKNSIFLSMIISVIILLISACSQPATQQADNPDKSTAEGESLYNLHCLSCHAKDAETVIVGPPLGKIGAQADLRVDGQDARKYLEISILQPGEYMLEGYPDVMPPDYDERLSSQEIEALVAYLLTLK